MDFDIRIFDSLFNKRPEISKESLKKDIRNYYYPFAKKLIDLKNSRVGTDGIIVGVSAIQGAGKTTQGEVMAVLLNNLGYSVISLSIDDYYLTHEELNKLREIDARYLRRGLTHDISLAVKNLTDLKKMKDGQEVKIPVYDKGAYDGDGDRSGWKSVTKKCDFIFYDGWMLGVRKVLNESIFESGLPALDSPGHVQFAKEMNKKLDEYLPLWDLIDFMNVLYVPNYHVSLEWRDQAEEALRVQGKGMSKDEIREFVYYFWRSVHPAIQIKNLAFDKIHTQQVATINDDHSIAQVAKTLK